MFCHWKIHLSGRGVLLKKSDCRTRAWYNWGKGTKGQIYIAASDEDKVLLEFCFLGRKRRFINNFKEGFCFLGGKRRFIKNFKEEFCFLGGKRRFINNET